MSLPKQIFRDDVEPKRGGKVPEAAKTSQRIELNKLDAVGLDRSEEDSRQTFFAQNSLGQDDFFQSPFSEEDYSSDFGLLLGLRIFIRSDQDLWISRAGSAADKIHQSICRDI